MKEGKRMLKCDWSIELKDHDLESLQKEVFINDQIVDFWLHYLKRYSLSNKDKARTYIFSSFFYTTLTNKTRNDNLKIPADERRHARVASWTKNEDIFKYDFILMPIEENDHWILAVICFPLLDGVYDRDSGELISELKSKGSKARGKTKKVTAMKRPGAGVLPRIRQPCILIFDSMAQKPRNKIYATLREYLRVEFKVKRGVAREYSSQSMPGCMPHVPQQSNSWDCGLYILQFAESFFSNPIKSFRPPVITELKTWFPSSVTLKKRQHIYNCVVDLVERENPENLPNIPNIEFDDGQSDDDTSEEEYKDVSTEYESDSSGISTKSIQRKAQVKSRSISPSPIRPRTLNSSMPTTVKVETPKTVKNHPGSSSTIVLSTIPNPFIQPSPPHLGIYEPSKTSLSFPTLSIKSTAASTTASSAISTAGPSQGTIFAKNPCYAKADSPVKNVPIMNTDCTMQSVSYKVSDLKSVRKQHAQGSQSADNKRSKMDPDKS